jgi:hypothetical protein
VVQLLISDANILIDLEEGGLIKQMFQLSFQFSIPDILFEEELDQQHGYLVDLGLELRELSGESMLYGMELTQKYTHPSRNDCFALALAKQENCPLLTGDKSLRAAAETEAVIVQGTLWVVEQLVRQGVISADQAREGYGKMKRAGRRLPWQLAETKLAELEKS